MTGLAASSVSGEEVTGQFTIHEDDKDSKSSATQDDVSQVNHSILQPIRYVFSNSMLREKSTL